MLRKYVGGMSIGAKVLYEEVPPGVGWSDPENRIIVASGPLSGTTVGGSGEIAIVTKGSLTNGATSTQASGFFGAYLKFSGFDGIILQGAAKRLVYLYIHDGVCEFKDADHLAGKDTFETEDMIHKELGKEKERDLSVFSIGPAGENLVRFAGILGDKGHSASQNGSGAVMGSKKLKALAVARGRKPVVVNNRTVGAAAVAHPRSLPCIQDLPREARLQLVGEMAAAAEGIEDDGSAVVQEISDLLSQVKARDGVPRSSVATSCAACHPWPFSARSKTTGLCPRPA